MVFFDANQVPDDVIYPEGTEMPLLCTNAEIAPNKAGNGQVLTVTWQTQNGEVIIDRFNFRHASKAAEKIGLQQLKKLTLAINTPVLLHPQELHNKKVFAILAIDEYEGLKKNVIKEYVQPQGAWTAPPPAQSAPPPAPTAPPPTQSAPPPARTAPSPAQSGPPPAPTDQERFEYEAPKNDVPW